MARGLITPTGRYHKAREARYAAWYDLDKEEYNDWARGPKRRALNHIDKANHIVKRFDRQ